MVKGQVKYPDVYNLLGLINEQQQDWPNALTAYSTYVALRFKRKTIQSEASRNLFKDTTKDNENRSDTDDSDFDDDDKSNKHPTPELIVKIATLAIKSKNNDMALEMIGLIESHYKHILNKINDPKNKNKIQWSLMEIDAKKKEINSCLINLYRQKVIIYKEQKQWDKLKSEYESIYFHVHRNTHPLIVSQDKLREMNSDCEEDDDDDDDDDMIIDMMDVAVDANHDELLKILKRVCPKSFDHTCYKYLFKYFDIFTPWNKFQVNHEKYLKWLRYEIRSNQQYRQSFYQLFGKFVNVSMKMCRFKAILKFIEIFHKNLSDYPFGLEIKEGICKLWLNRVEEATQVYDELMAQPAETGFGPLYMLFADACIAKNKLKMAAELMNQIQQIPHFMQQPRIWMRFADLYALQQNYHQAIAQYNKVIDTIQPQIQQTQQQQNNDKKYENEDEDILLSARLKLLEIYFNQNDDKNARKLLKIIQTYKEEQATQNDNESKDDKENDEEDDDNLPPEISLPESNSVSPTRSTTTTSVLSNTVKPQKRVRLNAQLTSYFDTGLFGSVLVPKELLHLELLNIELRSEHSECVQLFENEEYHKYLLKCESKIIELFQLCHSSSNLMDDVYFVTFNDEEELNRFIESLQPRDEQQLIGARLDSNFHRDNVHNVLVTKLSEILCINDEECGQYKLDRIKDILQSINLEANDPEDVDELVIQFINPQNIFPLLKENRNVKQKRIYTMAHLAHVLKNKQVLELVVLICKIWYQCDAHYDDEIQIDEESTMKNKFKQIETILNMITESASSLNPAMLELDYFLMAELHLLMANIYFTKQNFESCYHELVRVLELQPNNVNAMRYLYIMYRHLDHDPKIERAIRRQWRRRRSEDNDDDMVWHQLILGHTSFSKNSYDIAANIYTHILKKYEKSPFMNLMMAVTFLQHATKRTVKQKKYMITIQAMAFMKQYVKLSKNTTESLYNFARAFHLLGLYSPAQILYEKIIQRIKRNASNNNNAYNPILRYCAYNLSKIYWKAGQNELAINTLRHNIIV